MGLRNFRMKGTKKRGGNAHQTTNDMEQPKTYHEDLRTAAALIAHDEATTRRFFYIQCYPLFKSIFNNYYTGCTDAIELINELYVTLLAPSPTTGRCQMQNYRGESSLPQWVKAAALFYCYHHYNRKGRVVLVDDTQKPDEKNFDTGDRLARQGGSITMNLEQIERDDVEAILQAMPNQGYAQLIRLRYLQQLTNEETALQLDMTMSNYYNKHKRAKEQFTQLYRKEEQHG